MTDQTQPRRPAPTGGILVTGASGTVGRAVVDALAAAGETVVAGMRDPRAWFAEGARRASGTATGQQHDGPGGARPTGKPSRAPNRKPERNPAHKPVGLASTAPNRTAARPGAGAPAGAAGRSLPVSGASGPADAASGSTAVVRAFDFSDRGTWARALAGVDRVFLIVPPTVADVGRTLIPFIDHAMEEGGVRQIVFLSAPGVRFDTRRPQHLVEQYLKRTRSPYTILRPNVFLQTLSTLYRDDIRLRGEIVLPAAGAKAAFVDADDVGRVAARVLTEPGHLRKVYTLAGEQALGYAQVAEVFTEVLGRPVRYTATSEAEFAELAAKQGAAAADIAAQAGWYRAMRRRLTALPNRSIQKLTGRPATGLRSFVEEHRQTWL
jgi:uncharacterized protein YbjT (DUF2867 family)